MVTRSMLLLLGATLVGGTALCDWCETRVAMAAPAPVPSAMSAVAPAPERDTLQQVTLAVEGMTCGGCTLATRKVLTRLEGVTKAVVTYEPPRAVVTFDPQKVTVPRMIAAIETLGYRATRVP